MSYAGTRTRLLPGTSPAHEHERMTSSTTVQDVQVQGSHPGMGWNRQVLGVVADRLAQPTSTSTPGNAGAAPAQTEDRSLDTFQTLENMPMISPDTLAAALRVDQYAARRAMLAAVRRNTANEAQNSEPLPARAQATADTADGWKDAAASTRGQRDTA